MKIYYILIITCILCLNINISDAQNVVNNLHIDSLISTLNAQNEKINLLQNEINQINEKLAAVSKLLSGSLFETNSVETNLLKTETGTNKAESTAVKDKQATVLQCKATTQAGTRCKRNASDGSDYCWQHQNTSSGTTYESKSQNSSTVQKSTQTTSGRTIYTGPRGGRYYINSNGNKTYIRK